jgi:hypothetical protein
VSAGVPIERVASASIAYPVEGLALSMTDYGGGVTRAWMSAYHGVRVDISARRPTQGAGHFEFYRHETADAPGMGEIDRDGDDLSGDVLMDASMFDRVAHAYVNRSAHELWLTLYWADLNGVRELPGDKQTPIVRIGVSLHPASEAIL